MQVYHPLRRFAQVAVDVQTITPRTTAGNVKVLVIVDTFTRFAQAVAIPDERADTVSKVILDRWISIFGPMECLLSDRGPNFIGKVVERMADQLGVKRVVTSAFNPQANGCVERFNRTLAQDLACFVSTGQNDWYLHVALACFRYNSGINKATQMSPYRAMFGVEPFMAWGTHEAKRITGEPYDLPEHLRDLHATLLSRGICNRKAAAKHYDQRVSGVSFKEGDRVLVWSPDLVGQEGNKLTRPWLGPYVVKMMLSSTGYLLESEVGGCHARAHANRMRKISSTSKETGDPREGVFPDSLRLMGKIRGERRGHDENGRDVRWLKVKLGGRAAPCWTKTGDLPPAVVKIWDARLEGRGQIPISSTGLNRESYPSSGLGMRPMPAPVTLEAQEKGVQSSLNGRNEEKRKRDEC